MGGIGLAARVCGSGIEQSPSNCMSIGVLFWQHSQLTFDSVVIACSLESIIPDLVQGCEATNGAGYTCLKTSSETGLPH